LNGVVEPADSVAFSSSGNCGFYQWSEQMFLWMTSPAPARYGGGGARIFDSPTFYDVSPPDASGKRTFIPHTPGFIHPLAIRTAQVGPHGLPVVFAKSGKLMEVETVPTAKAEIRDQTGKLSPVVHAKFENGKTLLLDKAGQPLKFNAQPPPKPEPSLRASGTGLPPLPLVRKVIVDKIPIFIDAQGNVIDTEEGQAGGNDVLMAQTGNRLIYYVTMTNDVFAYFATAVKDNAFSATAFPTTQAQLDQVIAFASSHGRTLVDADALAIEAKSSWIEATGLANLSSYITMTATIPTYNTSNPGNWVPTGQKKVQLAMLGLHVVGSAAGHPEMIWATFEHVGNTPNATYSYINKTGATVSVPSVTAGTWLFAASGADAPFNQAHMTYIGSGSVTPSCALSTICATTGFTITPSNTIRWKPWGAASDARPNPLDASAAASNTEVISINDSVRSQLVGGDVRGNYLMIGSTWTIGGAAPNGSFSVSSSNNEVGTSLLNNSTMETYQQGTGTSASSTPPNVPGANCFSCHTTNTTAVSHVFSALQPLKLPPAPH
jgi:hypothetical protein